MKCTRLYYTVFCLLIGTLVKGQSLLFSNLNTSDGLSDNNARSITIDNNGFLWVGTSGGLNVYDGYNVTSYLREQYPEMASDVILHLNCDKRNRVWMGTYTGATWLDENRDFHRIFIRDTISSFYCPSIYETAEYGIVLYTDLGQYYFDSTAKKWKELEWMPALLKYSRFLDAEPFSENKIIFAMDSVVMLMDFFTKKILYEKEFDEPVSVCPVNEHEIAIGCRKGQVMIVDIASGKVAREYQLTNKLNDKSINTYLSEVRRASNGDLIVATDFAGLITIDKTGNIIRHTHNPLQPGSISANNTYRAFAGKKGEVVVGTYTTGVNMGNIVNKPAGYTRIFKDDKGNLFDNFVNDLAEEGNGIFWVCTYDRLIRWDKKNNLSAFYSYYFQAPEGMRTLEFRAVCMDNRGRVWVSVADDGISVFDKASSTFKKIDRDTSLGRAVAASYVYDLLSSSDGKIWAGSFFGAYTIDPATLKATSLVNHPVLKELNNKRAYTFFEDRSRRIWIGTNAGAYCYDSKSNSLHHYSQQDGLASNVIYGFAQDTAGSMYVGTINGFTIISHDKIVQSYTRKNGMHYERCEGMLADDAGNIWVSNNKCLMKFIPGTKHLEYYEENSGLSIDGFRIGAVLKARDGELLWGSQRGLNYFFPGQLTATPSQLRVSMYAVDLNDTSMRFSNDRRFYIPYSKNDITFHFTAVNLNGSHDIAYQYKLEGHDKEWHTGTDIREAHYSSLPAGDYSFIIRASADHINWTYAQNSVSLYIIPPIYKRWWFMTGIFLLMVALVYLYFRSRNKEIHRQKEQLETEQAINYFASGMYEQQKVDNILWDVARNCIGRLQFEDCVIYLLDEEKNVLVQKAAYGPKSPRKFIIHQPITIPLGRGIVGSIAASGKAEIIADTSKDPRYIVDDVQRFSEITVPIVSDGKVLGVIDCEHTEKKFFTQKHLSILTTIASLCANKIVRAKAEEEKEKTRATLMETQQKMTEVEMQALRAQMNPHFIFNCLNSINRYIVKSDQITASLYLTKFAKLIRLILDNSNSKNVILSNELEALKLYIDMEALRFDKKFSYQIRVDSNVPSDSIEVPPLIIQPYVENAIWHGLLHKPTMGHLQIHISMPTESMLQCVIEDNGIGREKAKELRSKSATTKKSLGMKLTENRLSLLNKHAELNASVEIIDLVQEDNAAAGTKVILNIPI